ncbi:hypothetical protein [Leptospira alstonii]|uniref:hypothetical protein n=1 Tax=Leptospira alstonii TaxID=28452 RepID=UPI0012FB3C9F|nr:hypothetical protein [Leptospira alstonii]
MNTGIVLLTLFCSLNLVFLDSLNKVDGYPDKELAFGLFLFAILLYHFWMLFLFIKYGKKYSTLIATNLLVLYLSSFVLLPISIIRQFVASKTVKEISTQEKKNTRILYFTKILSNTAYAIGRKEYSDGDYDVVLVFHFEGQYVYDRTLWLVSGQGSMDAQIPNQSKIYQKGSEYFLKYFGRP